MLVSAVSQLPSLALPPIGGPDRPAGRVHPADRSDQLPGPAAPRSTRMGVADDAGPGRRVHGRRLRVRGRPARQRRDRQRGGDRPRRHRRHRRHRSDLHRGLLAVARHLPAPGPGRRPAVVADQRRHLRRRRHGQPARRAPGRPGAGARPRRRVRLAADDPGRDRGRRAAHRDRPAPRGRPPQGNRQERLERRSSEQRPWSWAERSSCSAISRRAPRSPSTRRSRTASSANRSPTRSSARSSSATAARTRTRPTCMFAIRWSTS